MTALDHTQSEPRHGLQPVRRDNAEIGGRGGSGGASAVAAAADAADDTASPADDFSRLYHETFDAVFRYATLLAGNATIAEDIASEVYFKAWRSRDSFRGEGRPLSWLLSITHNTAATLLRRRARERPDSEAVDTHPAQTQEGPERSAEHAAERDRLLDAIRRLTPEQQQVIFLRFYGDRSHAEIARQLGRNEEAVRALQYRALRQLRKVIEPSA